MAHDVLAAVAVDHHGRGLAVLEFAEGDLDAVHDQAAGGLAGIGHGGAQVGAGHQAGVADLAAGFAVVGRAVQHGQAFFALLEDLDRLAVQGLERQDGAAGLQVVVTHEVDVQVLVKIVVGLGYLAVEARRGPRQLALLLHLGLEAILVHGEALLGGDVLGQIEREAEGIVELEGGFAGDDLAAFKFKLVHDIGQQTQTLVEGLEETLFLGQDDLLDEVAALLEFGVGRSHLVHDLERHLVEEALAEAQQLAVARGAADDAAQHVAATLVTGQHAVTDQKGRGAGVVGDHAHADVIVGIRTVLDAGQLADEGDQRHEQVSIVVAGTALLDGRDALEAHAGVDAGVG
ncbi:MAG: hypothetical protein BWY87_01126 [Deltaproteobacteria bacterium ADurb.Bin510]|nr:MAG: hypothetical protein BWY87_01126 [Deltaproteobacteria bacterium ADurb.Bin510]